MKITPFSFPRLIVRCGVPLVCLSVLTAARAQWIGTTTKLDYNDTANWKDGIINDVFQGPYNWQSSPGVSNSNQFSFSSGSTTVSTGSINAQGLVVGQSITGTGIPAGATITAINSANSITISAPTTGSSSGNYTVAAINNAWEVNLGATRTIAGGFTYQNTDPANVTFTPLATGSTWTFTSAAPVITVDMGLPGVNRTLQMGAASRPLNWVFQNGVATFAINPTLSNVGQSSNVDTMILYANITAASGMEKTGGGRLELYRTASVTGDVNISGGVMRLRSFSDTVFGKIDGASAINIKNQGASLDLISSHATGNVLAASTDINLQAGGVGIAGNTNQQIGDVHLVSGRGMVGNYSASDKTLTLSSLSRENYSTLSLVGNNQAGRGVGTGTLIKISGDDSNILADLVGGGGAAGSTTMSILPWASAVSINANEFTTTDNSAWSGVELVTYTTAGGFRALSASEYYAANGTNLLSGAGVNDNVKLSYAATVGSDLTINALALGATNLTQTISSGTTLTIASGAIVTGGNSGTISGGMLSAGNRALIISGRSSLTISSSITNSITDPTKAGLILANVGAGVFLTGTNTYGGATVVQGNATFNGGSALPSATELRVDTSGRAIIGNGITATVRTLSGNGTLEFIFANNSNRLNVGTVMVSAGNTLTVGDGGTISPGDSAGDAQAGRLVLGNNVNNLTFQAGSVFLVDIASASLFDSLQNTNTSGTNTLRIDGGTIRLTYLDGYTPEEGTSWLLTQGFGASAGNVANMSVSDTAGYTYSLSLQNNNLLLTVTSVPEPGSLLLVLAGLGWLVARRRRA